MKKTTELELRQRSRERSRMIARLENGPTLDAGSREALDEIVHRGAQEMLQTALEAEVNEFVGRHEHLQDERGSRRIVRNGRQEPRGVETGAGILEIERPRVRDRVETGDDAIRFTSKILPPYLRRSAAIDELVPWLYLKGVSTGDMADALRALLGPNARNLSANVVVQLKRQWEEDFKAWERRDLSEKKYVYVWADGIHFNIRLEEDRQCILVILGATEDGTKELLAVADGYRESEQSWHEMLADLVSRGLAVAPKLAVADGALGFWAALRKAFPSTREQRCWIHKMGNVTNKMPKNVGARARAAMREIWEAETRKDAEKAFDRFIEMFEAKYPKATECLAKDREVLLAFYDFPAEHWLHLRTTNPIESTFATVRLRHRRTKGSGSRIACLTMVFKLTEAAAKRWRRLNGQPLILDVMRGVKFADGLKVAA
jgi:transposase-like protein